MKQQQTTIDFRAIMSKPMTVPAVKKIKILTPDNVRALVRQYHPAGRDMNALNPTLSKPAFVK